MFMLMSVFVTLLSTAESASRAVPVLRTDVHRLHGDIDPGERHGCGLALREHLLDRCALQLGHSGPS